MKRSGKSVNQLYKFDNKLKFYIPKYDYSIKYNLK